MTTTTATIAKISYRLNVGRSDAETLPIGSIALFAHEGNHLFVLLARSKMEPSELKKMDWIAQQTLADPPVLFRREIDEALSQGGDPFELLADKFAWSIYVSPPAEVPIPAEMMGELRSTLTALMAAGKRKISIETPTARQAKTAKRTLNVMQKIAGPEFPSDGVEAVTMPAWMIDNRHSITRASSHF